MSDFHMVIPSNASPDLYPENKTSNYKVYLPQRFDLHGEWQVALLEVHYPNTLMNVQREENWVKVYEVEEGTYIPPAPMGDVGPDYELSERCPDLLNKTTTVLRYKLSMRPGLYTSTSNMTEHLADVLKPLERVYVIEPGQPIPASEPVSVGLDRNGKFYLTVMNDRPNHVIYFAPRLAHQLGLPFSGPYDTKDTIKGIRDIDLSLGHPEQMYIYMNIIEPQIVGHTSTPLLRTIPMSSDAKFGTMASYRCDHPIYHNLSTKSFNELEINIRTDTGDFVPFLFGTLNLVVHFRQRR